MGQRQNPQDENKSSTSSAPEVSHTNIDSVDESCFRLLDLPLELLDQILEYLSPVSLAQICQTCRLLNHNGSVERLWKASLADCIPNNDHSHKPFASWKEMYGAIYPYWFLPKHQIWFSNKPMYGQLMLARYSYRIGSIEGYRAVAKHAGVPTFFQWTHDRRILVRNFEPRLEISTDDPIVTLGRLIYKYRCNRLQQEVNFKRTVVHAQRSITELLIFPTTPIPVELQAPSMALWPPNTIPALERVRVESPSSFRDNSHKPKTYEQTSTTTFRLRTCVRVNSYERLEDIVTFSTILPEYYTPTTEKPYQGIWVGDYSGHGCEFLLIIQSTPEEALNLESVEETPPRSFEDISTPTIEPHLPPASTPDPPGHTGRLDAIKLTGDVNIPRGEVSWIAQDIGRGGLVRIAQEPEFRGARVVRSSGHIANTNFRNDSYTACHLIMYNENTLAQYWIVSVLSFFACFSGALCFFYFNCNWRNELTSFHQGMGHISFLKRVEIP